MKDEEILDAVKTVKHFKDLANNEGQGEDKTIEVTEEQKQKIKRGIELMNSSTNDKGELVFTPFRMCGFVPVNIPILMGIVCSAPTMRNTIFF